MPSLIAPRVTATSPVTTPARAESPAAPTSAPSAAIASTSSSAARTARSVSPSRATGVPQPAITASPMNFSMVPPYRATTVRAMSKYRERSSRTSSGSRDSDKGVKPTRSQNSTEQIRRSATGPISTAAGGAGVPVKACPQFKQNRAAGWDGVVPHAGQLVTGAAPQSPQTFALPGFCPRQLPHSAIGGGYRRPAPPLAVFANRLIVAG